MKSAIKYIFAVLTVIISLAFIFTPKAQAEYPPNYKTVTYVENNFQITIVYDQDGGIVEVIKAHLD